MRFYPKRWAGRDGLISTPVLVPPHGALVVLDA